MSYSLTDAGNAELFAAFVDGNWRYDHRRGKWFTWTGTHWEEDVKHSVINSAILAIREQLMQAISPYLSERDPFGKWYLHSQNKYRLNAMLDLAKSRPEIALAGDEWDRDPWLLGVENGAVDLRSGTPREVSRDDFISMRVSAPLDLYAMCPQWEKFLLGIFDGDNALVEYVQRAVGYSLTGDAREQCFFILWGEGQNGKTTFLETLKYVFGSYSVVLPFSSFVMAKNSPSIRNDLASLPGKRFLMAKESQKTVVLDEAVIKQLTGSDTIATRFLYKEYFEFSPVAKIWLAVNHKPIIRDETVSIWRRIQLLPFTKQFKKGVNCDDNLAEKLRTEAAGILIWAVLGCLQWQEKGLQPPAIVCEAGHQYRVESDPTTLFLIDMCNIGEGLSTSVSGVKEAYSHWAKQNGDAAIDYKEFRERLKQRGFTTKEKGHDKVWHWLGFSLKPLGGGAGGFSAGELAGMPAIAQTIAK